MVSKAAQEKARRIALGQCRSMLSEDRQCPHWATDTVNGRGYCGVHIGGITRSEDERRRKAQLVAAMNSRIDAAIGYHGSHPSVWDLMPEPPKPLELSMAEVWWNGDSGIGIHVPSGVFVIEQDGQLYEWEDAPDA